MAAQETQKCAVCEKATTSFCTGCRHGLDHYGKPVTSTYYSTKDCQTVDRKKHKAGCNNARQRQALYRSGEMIQELFYEYRRFTFEIDIQKVESGNDGKLHVHQGKGTDILFDFPEAQFSNDEDRKAMLAWNFCAEGTIRMDSLVKKAFKGMQRSRQLGNLMLTSVQI